MDLKLLLLERVGVRIHLTICRYCTRFRRQLTSPPLTMLRIMSRLEDPVLSAIGEQECLCEEVRKHIKNELLACL